MTSPPLSDLSSNSTPLEAPVSLSSTGQALSCALSVNVNKIALVRNSRTLDIPSVLGLSEVCLKAGAHGLTVHPRPDERHILKKDVAALSHLMKDWPDREFNIEGNPLHNLMDLVREFKPHQATLVPDSVGQSTSDHGWRFPQDYKTLEPLIKEIQSWGVRVSLFMDPIPEQMQFCQQLGVERVELYTESYARSFMDSTTHKTHRDTRDRVHEDASLWAALEPFVQTAQVAHACGLALNAGHDLNAKNLRPFLTNVPHVREVSIGHALMADALMLGYEGAVKMYLDQIPKFTSPV
jgi:pyridoxine 5-phosphate synthase